jgi:hypothetical protein
MAVDGIREKNMRTHTSIKFPAKLAAVVILGAAILGFTGCYYIPGFGGRPARANISMSRAALPANVASIALIVGGPGMDTIAKQYPVGTTKATLTIPSGVARTFTVLASTPSVTFRDDVTVDLAPDETAVIDLKPTLAASQIIVPDYSNSRLVQISDMSGAGWTAYPGESSIYPYDVDFDDQGRIYVASYGEIIQMDDISGNGMNSIPDPNGTAVLSIAMDRTNDLLYWADDYNSLWRASILPAGADTPVQVYLGGLMESMTVAGIAVDSDGKVYIADSLNYQILKIDPDPDPSNPTLVASYTGTLDYPWDVLVNGDYIYVSDKGALKIIRLSKDLKFVDSFSGPDSDHPFLGPERFIAILNKPITVIDENDGSPVYKDRLVSFGDMTGAGWTTYGTTGTGDGQFQFFSYYNP